MYSLSLSLSLYIYIHIYVYAHIYVLHTAYVHMYRMDFTCPLTAAEVWDGHKHHEAMLLAEGFGRAYRTLGLGFRFRV